MNVQGIDLCADCGDQFPPSGEALALFVAFIVAIPLAALGIGLAHSGWPSRWTRPWIAGLVQAALIAQGGCFAASLLLMVILLTTEVDLLVGAVLASPVLLHTALNIAGIVAWRRVTESLATAPAVRPLLDVGADHE